MPRASVGVGPVRVGSGCCVALVGPFLLAVIVAVLAASGAFAAGLTARKAERAVEKRLIEEYPAFGGEFELPGTSRNERGEPSVRCHRLTSKRFSCSWEAWVDEAGLCGHYHGRATVVQYRHGTEVTLSKPIGGDPCGPDGVNTQ